MQLSPEMIIAIALILVTAIGGLAGAVAWLGKDQRDSKRRCEKEGAECRRKQDELDGFIRNQLMSIASQSAVNSSAAVAELVRARHVLERAERRHPATASDKAEQTPTAPHLTHA